MVILLPGPTQQVSGAMVLSMEMLRVTTQMAR